MKEFRFGIEKIKFWVVIVVDPIVIFSLGIFKKGFTIHLKDYDGKMKLRWFNES